MRAGVALAKSTYAAHPQTTAICSALALMKTRAVRAHDTHHAIPNSNYGQYIMLWDWAMGTFKPHPKDTEELIHKKIKRS